MKGQRGKVAKVVRHKVGLDKVVRDKVGLGEM